MLITTENEILSMMPTARWNRPQQLFGYLEEEERVALEPLLGTTLYQHIIKEYDRLRGKYTDITATTVRPSGKAKQDPRLAHTDVTERLEQVQQGKYRETYTTAGDEEQEVPDVDMLTIRLIRICQQIEFYKMLSHKAGLLTVSFNEGGGMNVVTATGYDETDDKRMTRVVKDAYMSAGRAIDSLLLFLEADAKGKRVFTEKWQDADAFYLHKDLLFQTAKVLNEYLDIKGERMAYVSLVRDIRFCQNTYLKPRVGVSLLKAVLEYANNGGKTAGDGGGGESDGEGEGTAAGGETTGDGNGDGDGNGGDGLDSDVADELLMLLRQALAFFVESRRTELGPKGERLARRDSMTDAQQAMAMACDFIEQNIDGLGKAAIDTPIYRKVKEQKEQTARDKANEEAAACRHRRATCEQNSKRIFTGFPMTHRNPELK